MRAFLASTLLVGVLFTAGCGGGGGGSQSTGTSSSGVAAKPATQVMADAVKAADAASSVHMSGQITTSGQQIGVDLSIVPGKGATGSITLHGDKVDLVLVGKKGYMRAPAAFWKQFAGASGAALGQLLAGKWLEFPATSAEFGSLTEVANSTALFNGLTASHGKLVNKGATTYKGQSVIAIYNSTKLGTLYVAATGAPYPLALVETKQGSSGTVTFDDWNKSVSLTAPKGALDFSHLGASG